MARTRSLHIPAVGTKSLQIVGSVAHGPAAPMLGAACVEYRGVDRVMAGRRDTTPPRVVHAVVRHQYGA